MGVTYCGVFMCKQKGTSDKMGNKVGYHRVPYTEPQRRIWLQKIRRRDYFYNSVRTVYVCTSHFVESDYMESTLHRRRLKSTAVPSQFEWNYGETPQTAEVSSNSNSSTTVVRVKVIKNPSSRTVLKDVESFASAKSEHKESVWESDMSRENDSLKEDILKLKAILKLKEKKVKELCYKLEDMRKILDTEKLKNMSLQRHINETF